MIRTFGERKIILEYRHNDPLKRDEGVIGTVVVENHYRYPKEIKGVAIDIGAHIGSSALMLAKAGAQVFAFEPNRDNFLQLQKNIKHNHLPIRSYNWAVGDVGIRKFFLNPTNNASHSLYLDWEWQGLDYDYVITVPLSQIFKEMDITECEVLKMDCEGAEEEIIPEILDGLWKKIHSIYIEYHVGEWSRPMPERDANIIHLLQELKKLYTFEPITPHEAIFIKK